MFRIRESISWRPEGPTEINGYTWALGQQSPRCRRVKRSRKIEVFVVVLLVGLPLCSWLLSEIRWSRLNSPDGKFTNVREYLARSRKPSRVSKVEKQGETFFIAYSPMDTWLAMPSGPAGYVFDKSGQMVDWSGDTGDDSSFNKKWPLPQVESSLEELRRVGYQQSPGGQ